MIQFEIPLLPESVNRAYTIDTRRKTLVLTRRAWKKKSDMHIFIPRIEIGPDQLFRLEFEYHMDCYFQNKNWRRIDAHNFDKMLIDVISEKLGIDDSRLVEWRGQKVQSTEEKVVVRLFLINKETFDGRENTKDPQGNTDGPAKDYGTLWDSKDLSGRAGV